MRSSFDSYAPRHPGVRPSRSSFRVERPHPRQGRNGRFHNGLPEKDRDWVRALSTHLSHALHQRVMPEPGQAFTSRCQAPSRPSYEPIVRATACPSRKMM